MDPLINLLLNTGPPKKYTLFFNDIELPKLSEYINEDDTIESLFGKLLIVLSNKPEYNEVMNNIHINNVCMLYKTGASSYDLLGVYRDLPYSLVYLEKPIEDNYDQNILNSINELNHTPVDERKKILDDFNILEDTIRIYDLKTLMDNRSIDITDSTLTNGYIRKYWPFVDDETIHELYDSSTASGKYLEYIQKQLVKYEKEINDILQINQDKKNIQQSGNKPDNFMFYHLCLTKNLDMDIDIKLLFNNISLNNDIPVSILNMENYSDSRYKIFKEATKEISLQQFKQWKSGIILVPHLFESTSYYNRKSNCVTFCLNISNGLGNIKKYAIINISSDGVLELITEKNAMKTVSLRPDTQTNLYLETLIKNVNKVLQKCNYYIKDITSFDIDFLRNKDTDTFIKELGGKLVYTIDVSCGQQREHFDSLLEKNINQYRTFLRIREEDIPQKRKKDRETLFSTGHKFVYKRVSEYTALDSLEAMIMPFIINIVTMDQQAPVIKYVLRALYNDDEKFTKEARKLVDNTIKKYQTKKKIKRKRIERGISCRIQDVGQEIHLLFDSAKNLKELQRLTQFATVMIDRTLKNIDIRDNAFKLDLVLKSASPSLSSSRTAIDKSSAAAASDDDDGVLESSSSSSSSSSIQSLGGGGKIVLKQYQQNLIKKYDPDLLGWKSQGQGKGAIRGYSSLCLGDKMQNKQPYIIPDVDEVVRIEKLWKKVFGLENAFGGPDIYADADIHRDQHTEELSKGVPFDDSYIRWIKASSGFPEQPSFYICNRYWCVNCEAPIPDRHFKDHKTYVARQQNITCPFCKCGYYGLKDSGGREITPEVNGTILERAEPYWEKGNTRAEKNKGAVKLPEDTTKYLPGYLDLHSHYETAHNLRKDTEAYKGRIPCCYNSPKYNANDYKAVVQDKTTVGVAATKNWGKIVKPGHIGIIHPKINQIINEEEKYGELNRFGVHQFNDNGGTGLLNSLAIIYFNDITKDYKDIIDALELHRVDPRFFCKANNGDLISKFKTPYNKIDDSDIDIIITRAISANPNFIKFYNFSESLKTILAPVVAKEVELKEAKKKVEALTKEKEEALTKEKEEAAAAAEVKEKEEDLVRVNVEVRHKFHDNFPELLKTEPEFRVLCNIWTAYDNFIKQIHELDDHNILPVIQELEHHQATTPTTPKNRRVPDKRPVDLEERYICLFHIDTGSSEKINIVYPSRYYKSIPPNISYLVKTNVTYQPILHDESKSPTLEINMPLYNWCIIEHDKDTFNTSTLPVIDYGTLDRIPLLLKISNEEKISNRRQFQHKYYYVDSLSIARYIILKLSANKDGLNAKSIILPIAPYKILNLDGNPAGGTQMHSYKKEDGEEGKYSLFIQYHIKKGGAFNMLFKDLPTYKELEDILKKINDSGVFRKDSNAGANAYDTEGIFVDISRNKAVGYSVNDRHIIYFKEEDSEIEGLKRYDQFPYINDEEVEKDIFVDDIDKSEKKVIDERSKYKQQAINETLLYKQYTLEISSAISQEDSIELKKLADIDLSMDDTEKYLYKSMWQHDKRDKIRDLILKVTKYHTNKGKNNPFDAYPDDVRQIQRKCDRNFRSGKAVGDYIAKKFCNKRPLCKYSGKTCKLILGGKSYWSERPLKDLFVEMLTDDIYYGGLKAVKILNKEIKAVDSRLSSIYKSSDKELILTPLDIRNPEELEKLFSNRIDPNDRSAYSYTGGKRRTIRKKKERRRTIRKKKQLRTHKKKKQLRTPKKNQKRRTKAGSGGRRRRRTRKK